MAEDRYRLAPLREVRERSEVTRRGNLSTAIGDARITEASVAAAAARVEQTRTALHAATSEASSRLPRPAAVLVVEEGYRARLRAALAVARDEELRARSSHDERSSEVETARARLARARADREVIERHFAAWREAQRKRREDRE